MDQQEYQQKYIEILKSGIRILQVWSFLEVRSKVGREYKSINNQLWNIEDNMSQNNFSLNFLRREDILNLKSKLLGVVVDTGLSVMVN